MLGPASPVFLAAELQEHLSSFLCVQVGSLWNSANRMANGGAGGKEAKKSVEQEQGPKLHFT